MEPDVIDKVVRALQDSPDAVYRSAFRVYIGLTQVFAAIASR